MTGEHTFVYDVGDRLVEQVDAGGDGEEPQRIINDRRPAGWEQRRRVQEPNGSGGWRDTQTTTWEHHANGKLAELEVRNGSGVVASYRGGLRRRRPGRA